MRRAPFQHRGAPGLRGCGNGKDSCQARGNTPCAPRGGLCGCLAVRQTFSEAVGGTYRLAMPCMGLNLLGGPPLGALRRRLWGVFETCPALACRQRPGESTGGKADAARGSVWRKPDELRGCAGLTPADPATLWTLPPLQRGGWPSRAHDSYLVDSASSHMLVSKIKPCMSKYKQLYRETANGSLNQL